MFQALFAVTSGFLYVGSLLRGLGRGILGFRNLHTSHHIPSLPSPHVPYLLDPPIAPLEILEEIGTPSSSEGLIVTELPSLVLPSPIPTSSYELSLDIAVPNRNLELAPLFPLLVLISVLVLLLLGLVYVRASIARKISAFSRLARKNSQAFIFNSTFSLVLVLSLVSIFSLVPLYDLVPLFTVVLNFFSTRTSSLRLLLSPFSLPLLRTGPPAFASLITLMLISKLPIYHEFSNMIVNILQRYEILTPPDTRTPPLLITTFEQIVNETAPAHKVNWLRNLPSEPSRHQTPTLTSVSNASSHLELQYREQEPSNPVTEHKPEPEPEWQLAQPQYTYSAITGSQDYLRRQLEVFSTREVKLQAELRIAERKRRNLKDRVAALDAPDVILHADFTATTADETCGVAMMLDQQSIFAAEDHVIISTKSDLLALRARLQDAEDKITHLVTELRFERKLRMYWKMELNEEARMRRLYEVEMRRVSQKIEHAQVQLDLMDDMLPHSHTCKQSSAVAPDDTGQPPPTALELIIINVLALLISFITKLRPVSPKSLRQTPERNPHDPTKHPSLDHPRQISAWLDRISDSANSWRSRVKSLLETIAQLEAEHSREAESRERSERCLQDELLATKDKLGVTQEGLSSTMQELGVARQKLASTTQGLGVTQKELAGTKEQFRVSQKEVSKANRELVRERETHHLTRAQAQDATRELETCMTKLKEVQDTQRVGIDKLCETVDLLRQRDADLESLKAETGASKCEHLKAVALSTMLRNRVKILEAEVKSLSPSQRCKETHPAYDDSPLPCHVDPDPARTAHSGERPYFDLSPPSPPPPPSNILPNSQHTSIISLDNVTSSLGLPNPPDLSPTRHCPSHIRSGILSPSRASSLAFLPVGSSVGSVDWPPIGFTLQPSGKSVEPDSGVGILSTLREPLQEADYLEPTSSTVRNPLNLPPLQVTNSRPFILEDPVHHFGEHVGSSFQSIDIEATEPPDSWTPAGCLPPEPDSGSHHSARSSHTPPGSPPPMLRWGIVEHARKQITPAGCLPPEPDSGSPIHHSAPSSPSHTPPGSPPPMLRWGIVEHAPKQIISTTPKLPPPHLGLDPILVHEYAALEDSPCAFGRPDSTRRPNHYRAYTRQTIPRIEYGLPGNFLPAQGKRRKRSGR